MYRDAQFLFAMFQLNIGQYSFNEVHFYYNNRYPLPQLLLLNPVQTKATVNFIPMLN
jgi:hypothetical protein